MVKIYGAYPLLISEDNLIRRIDFYHKKIVLVSTRSTLTEYALRENVFEKFVEESKTAGFDIIKISENNVNIYSEEKKKLVKVLDYHNLKLNLKIGKKDPRRQLSLDDTIKKINEP